MTEKLTAESVARAIRSISCRHGINEISSSEYRALDLEFLQVFEAQIRAEAEATGAAREGELWKVALENGPWVDALALEQIIRAVNVARVKGETT